MNRSHAVSDKSETATDHRASRPLRITIITGPFYSVPPAPCGSVERMWLDLARAFVAKGHRVRLICCEHSDSPRREIVDGVRIIRTGRFIAPRKRMFAFVKDFLYSTMLQRHLRKGDVVITNSVMLPILTSLFGRRAGKLFINVNRMPKGQMRLYRFFPIAGFIAASTQIARSIIHETAALKSRTMVLHNPVDLDMFSPPAPNRIDRHNRRVGEKQVILYTGRIHPEKGLESLIRAFALIQDEFPTLRLKIQGPHKFSDGGGGSQYLQELRSLARTSVKNASRVKFEKAVYDRQQYAETLREADLYCYPTVAVQGEALPIAPLEAMATGLVPITTNLPVFEDYIRHGETGLTVDWQNPERFVDIANHVRKLLNDDELHQQMRTQAYETARNFSTEGIVEDYLRQFREIL